MSFKRTGGSYSSGKDTVTGSQASGPNGEPDSGSVAFSGPSRSGPRSAAWGLPRARGIVDSPLAAIQKAQASERRWKLWVGVMIGLVFLVWVAIGLVLGRDGLKTNGDSESDHAHEPSFKAGRVSKGMPKAEVMRILGKPDMVTTRLSGGIAFEDWTYSTGGSRSCVTFASGKVTDYLSLN